MIKSKKNKELIASLLLGTMIFTGMSTKVAAETIETSIIDEAESRETNVFDEIFNMSKTGYTGKKTKLLDAGTGYVRTSVASGCTSYVATLVNDADYAAKSNPHTVNVAGNGPFNTNIDIWGSARAGFWYRYKMVVPTLGCRLKGSFSVN